MPDNPHLYNVGERVFKFAGDYKFNGVIVSVFAKTSGNIRYVVENPDGILHIFSESQLTVVKDVPQYRDDHPTR